MVKPSHELLQGLREYMEEEATTMRIQHLTGMMFQGFTPHLFMVTVIFACSSRFGLWVLLMVRLRRVFSRLGRRVFDLGLRLLGGGGVGCCR